MGRIMFNLTFSNQKGARLAPNNLLKDGDNNKCSNCLSHKNRVGISLTNYQFLSFLLTLHYDYEMITFAEKFFSFYVNLALKYVWLNTIKLIFL